MSQPDREQAPVGVLTGPPESATLDPQDWDAMRSLGHRMVDDLVDDLSTVHERPVWRPVPDDVREGLRRPVPIEAASAESVYDDFRRFVQPYPRGNTHPRFWGWVNGSGLPLGMYADLLASAMNSSVGAFENAASLVEEQVLDWLKAMLDFPAETGAVLTSGCSMSTILGLAVARGAGTNGSVRRAGLAAQPQPLAMYASVEAHSSVEKAVELLGVGNEWLRRIPVDAACRIDLDALEQRVAADQRAGCRPAAVIANAGTVNTGAIDDLEGIADICDHYELWMHVDGAFGALAWLVPEVRPALTGLQRADSLAFDLHKWLYLPYDVGCIFIRDKDVQSETFAKHPAYLDSMTAVGRPATAFADLGTEMTRRFRALKVWMCLKEHGVPGFSRQIGANIAQAAHLAELVATSEHLQLMAPVALNVVCLRFVAEGMNEVELDRLNQQILVELWSSGIAVISDTRLNSHLVLRVANTNHRSRLADFDVLIDAIERIGCRLERSWRI
jgi:glutamate/tyrosine decarboxylase-like PLP-dependent enzyme